MKKGRRECDLVSDSISESFNDVSRVMGTTEGEYRTDVAEKKKLGKRKARMKKVLF